MKTQIYPLLLILICFQCTQKKTILITEFSQNDIKNEVLIDVRTPQEYQEGHLENAININLFEDDFVQQVEALGEGRRLYVYCKKGGRSTKAATLLDSLDFDVVNLTGGYEAYLKNKEEN